MSESEERRVAGPVTLTGDVELRSCLLGGEEVARASSGTGELEGKSKAKCEGPPPPACGCDEGW